MTAVVRPLLFAGVLGLCTLFLSTQDLPQNVVINIEPGEYTPRDIVRIMQEKKIFISYSQASLKKKKVSITQNKNALNTLLESIFDLESYTYLMKGGKILIIPKSNESPGNSSGMLYNHPEDNENDLASFNFSIQKNYS